MRLETYQHLVDILETSNTPMSTQEIATKIQLSRSVTSLYLNKLLEKGEVQQTGKKPVTIGKALDKFGNEKVPKGIKRQFSIFQMN